MRRRRWKSLPTLFSEQFRDLQEGLSKWRKAQKLNENDGYSRKSLSFQCPPFHCWLMTEGLLAMRCSLTAGLSHTRVIAWTYGKQAKSWALEKIGKWYVFEALKLAATLAQGLHWWGIFLQHSGCQSSNGTQSHCTLRWYATAFDLFNIRLKTNNPNPCRAYISLIFRK